MHDELKKIIRRQVGICRFRVAEIQNRIVHLEETRRYEIQETLWTRVEHTQCRANAVKKCVSNINKANASLATFIVLIEFEPWWDT